MELTALSMTKFKVGEREVNYQTLIRRYVCNLCGAPITVLFEYDWRDLCGPESDAVPGADIKTSATPRCQECGAQDAIPVSIYQRELDDAEEVLATLPPQFRALYGGTDNDKELNDAID